MGVGESVLRRYERIAFEKSWRPKGNRWRRLCVPGTHCLGSCLDDDRYVRRIELEAIAEALAKEEAVRIPASARLRRGIRSLGGQARGPCATVE